MTKGIITGPFGIKLTEIESGTIIVGTDNGGLLHGSERPRHEVKLPSFKIMEGLVSRSIWSNIMQEDIENSDNPMDCVSWKQMEEFLQRLNEEATKTDLEGEFRLPSESEWLHAFRTLGLSLPLSYEEILADFPHPNYRGAPTDGRPRIDSNEGSTDRIYRRTMKAHPFKKGHNFRSQTSVEFGQENVVFRLVLSPKRNKEVICVPKDADIAGWLRQEAVFALLIGILPRLSNFRLAQSGLRRSFLFIGYSINLETQKTNVVP